MSDRDTDIWLVTGMAIFWLLLWKIAPMWIALPITLIGVLIYLSILNFREDE